MNNIEYKSYFLEAVKITVFCLAVTGVFKLVGVTNNTLLIIFNMAVMSCAATFSVEQKHLSHVSLGTVVIVTSVIAGGIIGYYSPPVAKLLTIIYAGLAFYLSRTKYKTSIFVTGAVVFLVFTALPFNFQDGSKYAIDGLLLIVFFIAFYFLFDYKKQITPKNLIPLQEELNNHITALTAFLALSFAWLISALLSHYHLLSHHYWIGLTALVVIQSSQQKTVQTSVKRILINAIGAVFIVFLFNYVMPSNFLANFSLLVLFLFLIFFLGFSYIGRTLFIELFVLGFAHLLGNYQNAIALDRIILTLMGGVIVIAVTPICYFLTKRLQ